MIDFVTEHPSIEAVALHVPTLFASNVSSVEEWSQATTAVKESVEATNLKVSPE